MTTVRVAVVQAGSLLFDTGDLTRATFDLETAGHCARPDVFTLTVDETSRAPVRSEGALGAANRQERD